MSQYKQTAKTLQVEENLASTGVEAIAIGV
jgi:hypothetical protein